jgi:hypothetical protein
MPELFENLLTRRDLAQRIGRLSQIAGVQLLEYLDGEERFLRLLEFRTGTGLHFNVLVDRSFDIGLCEYRGAAIGWHSPAGFRHPSLHDRYSEGDLVWLRSASGLLVTCGLDHILAPEDESASHFLYPHRRTIRQPLHGRSSFTPGKLLAYGEEWCGDDCILFCEGAVSQAGMFAENLLLTRRIETRVGSNEISIHDCVTNTGFYRTPHMLLYHVNVGYPLLSESSEYVAPIRESVWASHADTYTQQDAGYRILSSPRTQFIEQVWEHQMAADGRGKVPVAILNPAFRRGEGLGLLVETNLNELPCHFEWQNFQEGMYVLGIEPCTNHVLGKRFARERNELIWLEHGDLREYTITFEVLEADTLTRSRERIHRICAQPSDPFPSLSGKWPPLLQR